MSTSEGQHRWESLEKTREARLRWYGHVRRKYDGYKDAEDGTLSGLPSFFHGGFSDGKHQKISTLADDVRG